MEKALVLLVAIALIILGARGTYKAVWNQNFPNDSIVTTPTSTTPNATTPSSSGAYVVPALPNTTANPSSTPPKVTPNVTTQSGQHVTVVTGGGVYPTPSVGRTRSTVISTGVPSWWPSWLGPYPAWFPHSGEGQTGQDRPTPGVMGGG